MSNVPWIPSLGIELLPRGGRHQPDAGSADGHRGGGGILFSWNIEHRAKEFFAFYLALIGGVYGVFLSFDLFLLFVFYELAIIPKYFLIAIWGSTSREYGAMKLALYSFVGSAMVLDRHCRGVRGVRGANHRTCSNWRNIPFPRRFKLGVSAGVHRLRDSGRHVAVSHLGADRSRGGADGGLDAAGRRGDETGRLRRVARGDDFVPAGTGGVAQCNRACWR